MTNAEQLRARRQKAAALGFCACCRARPAKLGCRRCQVCIDANNAKKAEYRSRGLCLNCLKPTPNSQRCTDCNRRARVRSEDRKASAGLCLRAGCSSPHALGGHIYCRAHLDVMAEKARYAHRADGPVKVYRCSECRGDDHTAPRCPRLVGERAP